MILPAVILMFSAYSAIRGGSDSLTELVDIPVELLIKSQSLQAELFKLELPFHLYINRGDAADRELFVRLSVEIDLLFDNITKQAGIPLKNKEILQLAQDEWYVAKSLGEKLLTHSNIPTQNELSAKIDQFGRHLGRSTSLLNEINVSVKDAIKHRHFAAQENEWKSIGMLVLVFVLGLLIAILAGLSLGESVIEPIRRLEKMVNRFGQGETGARITLRSNDELGGLASGFNVLAERFEHLKGELDYLSVHDNLTGLYNRAKLHAEVTSEMERAKRYSRSFSLLLIDIDNFDQVNETFGRLVGDSVLCSVANKICGTVRPTDVSSRYGGDEFAIILSETGEKGAKETIQRLRQVIENEPLNIGDGKQLSISITVVSSTYPLDVDSEVGLFAFAEQLLSRAKFVRVVNKNA